MSTYRIFLYVLLSFFDFEEKDREDEDVSFVYLVGGLAWDSPGGYMEYPFRFFAGSF